jgi:hypothetical protein
MTMNTHDARRSTLKPAGALVAGVLAIAGIAATAWADTAPVWNAKVEVPAGALSVGDIESRLGARGMKVKELEIRDLIAEVEAYDPQGREVELIIDRRNGETLSHRYDD